MSLFFFLLCTDNERYFESHDEKFPFNFEILFKSLLLFKRLFLGLTFVFIFL